MPEWTRIPERFICRGLNLTSPVDAVPQGKYPILRNVRAYRDFIQPRPGISSLGNTGSGAGNFPVHSIRRLNDEVVDDFIRVVGSGTKLFSGKTGAFTLGLPGFSGDPLAMVSFRPTQSPRPWMYVADRSRMMKIRQGGVIRNIGLAPPTEPPFTALDTPVYKDLDDFDYANDAAVQAAWVEGGDAGNPTQLVRVNTTISQILYDFGDTGWASVQPAAIAEIFAGIRLIIDDAGGDEEDITVQSVLPASTSANIDRIIYDSGTTGLCTITLVTNPLEIRVNSLVRIAAAENVRVLSVTAGPGETRSFRCSTTATRAAGNAVVALASFRAFFTNTHAAAEDIDGLALTSVFGFSSGKGTLTNTAALDLSDIASGRQTTIEDIFHISLRFSSLTNFVEGRILIDIDDDSYDQNYLVFPFRSDDLTPAIVGQEQFTVARERVIIRDFAGQPIGIEVPAPPPKEVKETEPDDTEGEEPPPSEPPPQFPVPATSQEAFTGENQWFELCFRVRDMLRVGTSDVFTLKDVGTIRIELEITDTLTLDVDSWWLGGAAEPFVSRTGAPYVYRYRGRDSLTGAVSNFSPVIRGGIKPQRQIVHVALPGQSSIGGFAGEISHLDIARFGGDLLEWHYIGTALNFPTLTITAASNATPIVVTSTAHGRSNGDRIFIEGVTGNTEANGFWEIANVAADTFELVDSVGNANYVDGGTVDPAFIDNFAEDRILVNPSLTNNNFQPWPTVDISRKGTTTAVAGTMVQDSGSNFNTSWAPGTIIHLDNVPYIIYRVLTTSLLALVRSAGGLGVVRWDIFEPILLGQPLPTLWGPFEGYMMAVGDPNNPGLLYYSKQSEPDSTLEANTIEITSPSEPLMNGIMYNGRGYVFSTERLFALYPAFCEPNTQVRWVEVPNGKGMFSRWGVTVGPKIWFLAKDGIYETTGGEPVNITNADLYPLFPHEGQPGEDVNGIEAPDMAQPTKLRLSYYDGYLYFDYRSNASTSRTLVYDTRHGGWFYDEYSRSGSIVGAVTHYGEEGQDVHALLIGLDRSDDGEIYTLTGSTEDGNALSCQVRTRSDDQGDPRSRNQYGDAMIDVDTVGDQITVQLGIDSHQQIVASDNFVHNGRDQHVLDINQGVGVLGRNVSADFAWESTGTVKLYLWEHSVIVKPDDVLLRGTDYEDAGMQGVKFVQGVLVEADTKGVDRAILIQRDNNVTQLTLTVNHDGRIRRPYSFAIPFHAHKMRFLPADAGDWRLFSFEWIFEPAPELVRRWITQPTSHDLPGYQHFRDAQIALISTDEVTLTITSDGAPQSFGINSTGGELLKRYIPLPPMKGKVFIYELTGGTGFRLYAKDCEFRIKAWGSTEPYTIVRPFGGDSRAVGARI